MDPLLPTHPVHLQATPKTMLTWCSTLWKSPPSG